MRVYYPNVRKKFINKFLHVNVVAGEFNAIASQQLPCVAVATPILNDQEPRRSGQAKM